MRVFQVTVIYTHKDGRTIEAVAIVGAADASEAIEMATAAVREFPHCAKVQGGICEDISSQIVPDHMRASDALMPEPASATRH